VSHRRDHYAVLGVAATATAGQIRSAYRRLARAHHPDRNPDPAAAREFKRVARAYEVLHDASSRRAYDERFTRGRFAGPGSGAQGSFAVEGSGPLYHSDLGHHSDFYQAGDPLSVGEAARLVGRNASWLRRAIRDRRLRATRGEAGYLLRRRDVELLDRTAPRRRPRTSAPPSQEEERVMATDEGAAAEA
jgi:DnaJ-class molecular chaperone